MKAGRCIIRRKKILLDGHVVGEISSSNEYSVNPVDYAKLSDTFEYCFDDLFDIAVELRNYRGRF